MILSYYRTGKYIAFCTSGYRSVVAASILRKEGFNIQDIYGGFAAISVSASELTTSGKVRMNSGLVKNCSSKPAML